jgi:hypothetical protein
MRRKHFMLTVAAAAVLGAFNPAFAQDSRDLSVNASPNVGVDANVGIGNTDINAGANISPGVNVGSGDQSVSSGVSANQSSTDIGSSSSMNQSTTTDQASGS